MRTTRYLSVGAENSVNVESERGGGGKVSAERDA